jgi:hypothetical protein
MSWSCGVWCVCRGPADNTSSSGKRCATFFSFLWTDYLRLIMIPHSTFMGGLQQRVVQNEIWGATEEGYQEAPWIGKLRELRWAVQMTYWRWCSCSFLSTTWWRWWDHKISIAPHRTGNVCSCAKDVQKTPLLSHTTVEEAVCPDDRGARTGSLQGSHSNPHQQHVAVELYAHEQNLPWQI